MHGCPRNRKGLSFLCLIWTPVRFTLTVATRAPYLIFGCPFLFLSHGRVSYSVMQCFMSQVVHLMHIHDHRCLQHPSPFFPASPATAMPCISMHMKYQCCTVRSPIWPLIRHGCFETKSNILHLVISAFSLSWKKCVTSLCLIAVHPMEISVHWFDVMRAMRVYFLATVLARWCICLFFQKVLK